MLWRQRRRPGREQASYPGQSDAFTLLELLVVISVLALLAGVVATRVGGAQQKASFEQAMGQWEFFDQLLRTEARRHGRIVELRLEIGTGQLARSSNSNGQNRGAVQALAGGVKLSQFVSATRSVQTGGVTVTYGPQGTSETFAVKLAGPGGKQQWMMVAGLTGQLTRLGKDSEVQDVLQALAPEGLYTR